MKSSEVLSEWERASSIHQLLVRPLLYMPVVFQSQGHLEEKAEKLALSWGS